ncbi:hypothetical protein KFU94_70310 [Chloroflexi bacterium TSY]|nr:hypothetical protein [Chloroflexi bacterium TSY]
MEKRTLSEAAIYEIRVKGLLDQRWTHWFDGMVIVLAPERGETVMTGMVSDQAALHGLLARIRDLGLPLLALTRIEEEK